MDITKLPAITRLIESAIDEDLNAGDITSEAIIPIGHASIGKIRCKERAIICGQVIAKKVFAIIDPSVEYNMLVEDGCSVDAMSVIAEVKGETRSILASERTSLNFLQRLSGIATTAQQAVRLLEESTCTICDTRKTTPGWRILEKYAIRIGGAKNHRISLGDGMLIKDNHIKAAGGIFNAVNAAKRSRRHLNKIQVEISSIADAIEAVKAGADALLIDNLTPTDILPIVQAVSGSALLEASGGINFNNLRDYSQTGVDMISMGMLTHSVRAIDISLKLE